MMKRRSMPVLGVAILLGWSRFFSVVAAEVPMTSSSEVAPEKVSAVAAPVNPPAEAPVDGEAPPAPPPPATDLHTVMDAFPAVDPLPAADASPAPDAPAPEAEQSRAVRVKWQTFTVRSGENAEYREPGLLLSAMVLQAVKELPREGQPALEVFHPDHQVAVRNSRPEECDFLITGEVSPDIGQSGGWWMSIHRLDANANGKTLVQATCYLPEASEFWPTVAAIAARKIMDEPGASQLDQNLEAANKQLAAEAQGQGSSLDAAEYLLAARSELLHLPKNDPRHNTYDVIFNWCVNNLVKSAKSQCARAAIPPDALTAEKHWAELQRQLWQLKRLYAENRVPTREYEDMISLWRRRRLDCLLSRSYLLVDMAANDAPVEAAGQLREVVIRHARIATKDRLWNYRVALQPQGNAHIRLLIQAEDGQVLAEYSNTSQQAARWLDNWLREKIVIWRYMTTSLPGNKFGFVFELRSEDNEIIHPATPGDRERNIHPEYELPEGQRFYIAMKANRAFHPLLLYLNANGDVDQLYPGEENRVRERPLFTACRFPGSDRNEFLYAEPPFGPETIKVFGFMTPRISHAEVSHRGLSIRAGSDTETVRVMLGDKEFATQDVFTETLHIRTMPKME